MSLASEKPGVHSYAELAFTYDAVRFVGATNQRKEGYRRHAILSLLPTHSDRALDVACGTGRGLLLLRDRAEKTFGIDGTIEMLQHAASKLSDCKEPVRICNANAAALPFADDAFDVVTCLNFLHLFSQPSAKKAFVGQIARVLKPGGTAVIEFDNALHGLVLGPLRKYVGHDIGYEWPWELSHYFGEDLKITRVRGTNVPFVWRIPVVRELERFAGAFPLNYLSSRLLVQATKLDYASRAKAA